MIYAITSIYFFIYGLYYLYIYIREKKKFNLLLGIVILISGYFMYGVDFNLPIYMYILYCIALIGGTINMIIIIKKIYLNKRSLKNINN